MNAPFRNYPKPAEEIAMTLFTVLAVMAVPVITLLASF
jgi:hypothetical protein